jgi:hypothetical protein
VRFSGITGEVVVREDCEPDGWKLAEHDTILTVLMHIRTGENSSAVFTFADGRRFRLDFTIPGATGYFLGTLAAEGNSIKVVRYHDMAEFTFVRMGR